MPEPALLARPEDFVKIPGDEPFYASVVKSRNYQGKVVTGLPSYVQLRLAKELGLYPLTSAEWGKSRRYFEEHPDELFGEMTGRHVEYNYISGEAETVATFLSFIRGRDIPEDVSEMLRKEGFRGRPEGGLSVVLIDRPDVAEDEYVLLKGLRTRIIDVTDKTQKALVGGFIQDMDEELGIVTAVGPEPNPQYQGGKYETKHPSVLRGTVHLIRGHRRSSSDECGRFGVSAFHGPSARLLGITTRLCSKDEPTFLDPEGRRTDKTKEEASEALAKIAERYALTPERVTEIVAAE